MISALIPARGGSKGIPNKNILDIGGYPLIVYSIIACKNCEEIDKVYVSTDSDEIIEIVKKYDVNIIKRPSEFATDTSTDFDVVKHFFSIHPFRSVAYIRPTTPERSPEILKLAIRYFRREKKKLKIVTGMRSMHQLVESPYKSFMIDGDFCQGLFPDFNGIKNYTNLPRQMFPKVYHPNGYIDILMKDTINKGSDFGENILPFVTDRVYELDVKEDIECVEISLTKSKLYDIIKV